MRVLGFGTYDAQRHPRIEVLLDGMRAHGLDVSELVRPLGLSTAERVRMLQQPWRVAGLGARVLSRWARLAVAARRRGPRPDVVVVGYLGHFDVLLARLLFPRSVVVLDHLVFAATTATDRGTPTGVRTWLLGLLDRAAIAAADVVVVDTDEHRALVPAGRRSDTVVAPVGAPSAWFTAAAAQASGRAVGVDTPEGADGRLTVIFYGLFTPLQGAPVIGRALRLLHERGVAVRATLVGDGQDAAEVRDLVAGLDEVRWLPWVDPPELPAVVAAHDVCLGIFGASGKALRVVPNKVYQGAAAGTAVVTADTAPQRRVLGDAAVLVPPGSAPALADALARLAADPGELAARRRAAADLAARAFTPAAVAAPVVEALQAVRPRAGGGR